MFDSLLGGETMTAMTVQELLPVVPARAVQIGPVAGLVEDEDGGQVYVRGQVVFAWEAGDEPCRRLAAVQLIERGIAKTRPVAAAFGVADQSIWRWRQVYAEAGVAGLVGEKKGPKRASRLTDEVVEEVLERKGAGGSNRAVAAAVGVSEGSVRRAMKLHGASTQDQEQEQNPVDAEAAGDTGPEAGALPVDDAAPEAPDEALAVLGEPVPRTSERGLARAGLLGEAAPEFIGAARVPLAGMLAVVPALQATGLLWCARRIYGRLPAGFYGLQTVLLEAVFRALAGAPRAEGAGRFAPVDLGRVLGMDRAPEVKTIRRKFSQLAEAGKAGELLGAMAAHHLAGLDHENDENAEDAEDGTGLVLYVDGHVRAYSGTKKIAKTHSPRLRFPAPATVETWVADAAGDPVLVVLAEPGASLASELRRLLPELREAVGDQRPVLVGFDRGGWSPALFAHMHQAGFDVLTWRKGATEDVAAEKFTETVFTDGTGRQHRWMLAETTVELALRDEKTFTMRQISRLDTKKGQARQAHLLTTREDLSAGELMFRMGARWRQENHFRYGRMHLDLDSHDTYAATDDDPARSVPNPAKRYAHQAVKTATAKVEREQARAQQALLAARSPAPSQGQVILSNELHNELTGPWRAAADELTAARAEHAAQPDRGPLGELAPGQQVLQTETKLVHHAVRIAAFNASTALARDIRLHTGYARAGQEAFTLARQLLTHTGDIDPRTDGELTVRLDPMPTGRQSAAIAELCQHLTATATTFPGTELTLRYEMKSAR